VWFRLPEDVQDLATLAVQMRAVAARLYRDDPYHRPLIRVAALLELGPPHDRTYGEVVLAFTDAMTYATCGPEVRRRYEGLAYAVHRITEGLAAREQRM
jgi:hypothetical protein